MRPVLGFLSLLALLALLPGCGGSRSGEPARTVATSPEAAEREADESELHAMQGPVRVPRVLGLRRAFAAAQMRALGLDVRIAGPGNRVRTQSPSPGRPVRRGTLVRLTT